MINQKYVMFSEILLLKDHEGRMYCDSLWAKDLKLHTNYIKNLSLCCPTVDIENASDFKNEASKFAYNFSGITDISSFGIRHVYDLNLCQGWSSTFLNFIPNFIRVAKACKNADITHSGGAGWPFPLSYYLLFLQYFFSFKWIMLIESTYFRLTKDEKFNLRRFTGHHFHTAMLRACVNASDARIFTQQYYKDLFLKGNDRALVAAVSWLNDEQLLTENQGSKRLNVNKNHVVKMILAGRLVKSKGIYVLFKTIRELEEKGIFVQIDIMGGGELETECREFIKIPRKHVKMSFLESAPYGTPFFDCIKEYNVLLLPSLNDEQPRIIFDAFSQGLCVVGSNTTGIAEVCQHKTNAILFETGDSTAMTNAIIYATKEQKSIIQMGLNGLKFAKTKTHQQMHADREGFLKSILSL